MLFRSAVQIAYSSAHVVAQYDAPDDALPVAFVRVAWGPEEEPAEELAAFRASVARIVDRVWQSGGWVVRGTDELVAGGLEVPKEAAAASATPSVERPTAEPCESAAHTVPGGVAPGQASPPAEVSVAPPIVVDRRRLERARKRLALLSGQQG